MKCIRCGHDSKYPERTNRTCPRCRGVFAFEPREGDPVTDMAFQRAIDVLSAGGKLRWGVEHLYYEVCRRKRTSPALFQVLAAVASVGGVLSLILALAVRPVWWVGVVAAGVVGLLVFARRTGARFVKLDAGAFRGLYDRWVSAHGSPAGVIARRQQPAPRKTVEPDVADYSFDRAVVCDRVRTVDLLLANNFHFENNCAVLSVEGYPPRPFETVRAMLKRNPRLQVFALHDATPDGCRLAHRLATDPAWFAGQVKVIDVGLRPVHGARFAGLLLRSKTPLVPEGEGITAWEKAWLAAHALELAAVRPEQVLKRLFRALNLPINPASYPGDVIYLPARHEGRTADGDGGGGGDGGTFGSDAGDADGPADSFG